MVNSLPEILAGNTNDEGSIRMGWFIGHFVTPAEDIRSTNDVEVKWDILQAGETKPVWAKSVEATTLSLLIKGKFHLHFPDRDVSLLREGDYAIWSPGIFHTWDTEEDSIVLTIRWPSRADDVVIADEVTVRDLEQRRSTR